MRRAAQFYLPARSLRVLLVKRDKLGDLLLTTPVIARLAEALPHAEIHLLANDYNAWVARDHPALARTWTYQRVRSGGRVRPLAALRYLPIVLALRRLRFDAALVMGGDESPRAIRRAIGVRAARVVAYAADPSRYGAALTDALPVPVAGHEVERMLALLGPLGIAPGTASHPRYDLPRSGAAFARDWLRARALEPGNFVLIGLGARRAKKQPDAAQVLRWSERLWRGHGLATVLTWTPGRSNQPGYPGDDAIANPVIARGLPFLHAMRGTIGQSIAMAFHARTSILPDSGLMHFAAASPGGVLGLFADPVDSAPAERWSPRGARVAWLEAGRRVTDLGDAEVFTALAPLLVPPAP